MSEGKQLQKGPEKTQTALTGSGPMRIPVGACFSRLRWSTVLCLFILACIAVLFFHRVVFHPDSALASVDIVSAHSEYKFVQWRAFRDWGLFPLWDPTVFCGKSIIGDSLPALLNPPQWLFWGIPSLALFGYLLWFYAVIGAWGMFLLAKKKGCDPLGAMLAAVIFALGGKTAGHLYAGHVEVLATMLCLPWIMLAAENVLSGPSFFRAALLGAVFALTSTCGCIQIMYWHFLFVCTYALLWLSVGIFQRGWRATIGSAVAFAGGILSFIVLAGPWWLPIVRQTLLLSARARGTDYAFASAFSPEYGDLFHLVWPFHGILPPTASEFSKGTDPMAFCFWEKTIYVGVIPLALLLPACLWSRKNRSVVMIPVVLMALTFTLGMGNHGPLFWLATKIIPGFGLFRCPGRLFFYTTFLAALLVGLFVSGGGATARKWVVPALSGMLLAAVAAMAVLLPRMEGAPITDVWLPVILLGVFTPLAILWAFGILPGKLWQAAVLLLVCCDLFVVWQDHIVVAKADDLVPSGLIAEYLVGLKHGEEFRMMAPGVIDQTRAARDGLEIINGYHPGVYGRYLDLYRRIWKSDTSESTGLQTHFIHDCAQPVILDLMNVVYVVVAPPEPGLEGKKALAVPGNPRAKIYRRDSALPRVCMVPGAALPAPGVPMLDAVCAMDPRAGCLVEDRPFEGGDAYRPLTWERKSPSDLTTRFTSEKGGVVVISQAWHPDWRATDHGRPVEVRRVNYDFVGVCVGSGDHEIRVWYRPWDFYLGCWIAAAAWAVLVISGVRTVRKRQQLAKAA